jgi:hypothetical protein
MSQTTTRDFFTTRRVLSIEIAVYLIIWTAGIVFASQVFGAGLTIGLSLIVALPFAVAVRMRSREGTVERSELAILFALFIFALASCVCVASLYSAHFWFAVLTQRVHCDPAFDNIELSVDQCGSKNPFHIRGTVVSQSDLDRLESLLTRYGFHHKMHRVEIDSSPITSGRLTPSTMPTTGR